jgi:hypothetical protein
VPQDDVWSQLRTWWLAHEQGANTPNWDIAVSCEIEGRTGLILVEAKANAPELSHSGKVLPLKSSDASQENHKRIGQAIDEACTALRRLASGIAITRDSHYQLANRVAFAWKLASLGIPTVLVYLGFLGDYGITDAGEPFRDEPHWHNVFEAYAHATVPPELFERRLDCGLAPTWFLVRARPVLTASGPAAA